MKSTLLSDRFEKHREGHCSTRNAPTAQSDRVLDNDCEILHTMTLDLLRETIRKLQADLFVKVAKLQCSRAITHVTRMENYKKLDRYSTVEESSTGIMRDGGPQVAPALNGRDAARSLNCADSAKPHCDDQWNKPTITRYGEIYLSFSLTAIFLSAPNQITKLAPTFILSAFRSWRNLHGLSRDYLVAVSTAHRLPVLRSPSPSRPIPVCMMSLLASIKA